jgi:hypothetical protein
MKFLKKNMPPHTHRYASAKAVFLSFHFQDFAVMRHKPFTYPICFGLASAQPDLSKVPKKIPVVAPVPARRAL